MKLKKKKIPKNIPGEVKADKIVTKKEVDNCISHIDYITPQGKKISFNQQQISAINCIKKWLNDNTSLGFTLSGFAGTGKTTLINYVIRNMDQVAVSAPTHKAKIIISKATGKPAQTIQKLLGLKPNTDLDDFDVNNPQFDPLGTKYISFYKLVVIDEASMLNKDLFSLIVKEAKIARVKVIFMGDEAQLPPINEFKSDVFSVRNIAHLDKVERQSFDNPLMLVYDAIRNNISSKEDMFKRETILNNDKGIIFYEDEQAFTRKMLSLFDSEKYQEDKNYVKLISYSNASVKYWNSIIRESIIGKNKRILEPGDILMSYTNILLKSGEIYNSSDYYVQSVKESMNNYEILVYNVVLKDIDSNEIHKVDFIVPEKHNIEKFKRIINVLLDEAKYCLSKDKKIAWAKYYTFKGRHCLMEAVGAINKDFDYGYAITVHKSQGSTYTNVFVDEGDINLNRKYTERNKLKYVAFSRPTDTVYCLNTTISSVRNATEPEKLLLEIWNKVSQHEDITSTVLDIGKYLELKKLL